MMATEESDRLQSDGEMRGGARMDGVNCLTYDEAIIAQQDRIQQEIAGHTPLLSDRLDLSVLYQEYASDDLVYQDKIKDLHRRYTFIRRTRPDGNCFYRAFGYSYLEALLDGGSELERFKDVAVHSKEDLIRQGFTEFTIEDFHNTFMDLIALVEKRPAVSELLAAFNEQTVSDYVVVYLRLLTSGHLQRENVFYQHFIEGGRSVKEFCQQILLYYIEDHLWNCKPSRIYIYYILYFDKVFLCFNVSLGIN
ncbi:ubiquitin thioesterase OTUB1 isoform X3 [Rhinoderma darwinii]|uniref:ubiquitin thioesterase OTUB1 isoform X3 n=1 Tax=Rhinoderma darwinii TaxID=43563 RepID=UPI003F66558D